MATQIDTTTGGSFSTTRQVVRLSNGDLIVSAAESGSNEITIYHSTDDGSTWSALGTVTGDSAVPHDMAVDSSDQLHIGARNGADTTAAIYSRAQVSSGESYDVTSATHSQSFNPSDGDYARAMAWKPDGTRFYVLFETVDLIAQYDCSTAYDISTASQSGTLGTEPPDNYPHAITWNNDGTKLYMAASQYDSLYEYDVSTAYDVTTASQTNSHDYSTETSTAKGVIWNGDGTEFIIVGSSSATIYRYLCSTAYDVTTATYDSSVDVSTNSGTPTGLAWNGDGTKLFISDSADSTFDEYHLSTAYDASTLTYAASYDASTNIAELDDVTWNDTGSKMYGTNSNAAGEVHEFDIATGTTLSTDVSAETIHTATNGVEDVSIAIDSTDTVYSAVNDTSSVSGTVYTHLRLLERTGSATWTDHGGFATGSVNHHDPSVAVDGVDDIHVAWGRSTTDAMWTKYDVSAAAFVTNETIRANTSAAVGSTSVIIDSADNEPIVGYNDDSIGGGTVTKRSSGSWSGSAFDTDAITEVSLSWGGSRIYAIYRDSTDDIYSNNAGTVSDFDPANQIAVEEAAATLTTPSSRWQFYNENDPATDVVDFVYLDSTNSTLYYSAAEATTTLAGTVTLDGTAQEGATVYIIDTATDTVDAVLTTDTNGDFSHTTSSAGPFHVSAQYDDGTSQYNAESLPYVE